MLLSTIIILVLIYFILNKIIIPYSFKHKIKVNSSQSDLGIFLNKVFTDSTKTNWPTSEKISSNGIHQSNTITIHYNTPFTKTSQQYTITDLDYDSFNLVPHEDHPFSGKIKISVKKEPTELDLSANLALKPLNHNSIFLYFYKKKYLKSLERTLTNWAANLS